MFIDLNHVHKDLR